jgi:hypothetical protein
MSIKMLPDLLITDIPGLPPISHFKMPWILPMPIINLKNSIIFPEAGLDGFSSPILRKMSLVAAAGLFLSIQIPAIRIYLPLVLRNGR